MENFTFIWQLRQNKYGPYEKRNYMSDYTLTRFNELENATASQN